MRYSCRRRGIGLVELLVAMAISAALLTSVAMAVNASFKAYAVNQSQGQLMQRARMALNRMVTYVRATNEHRPDDDTALDSFESGLVTTASSIRMMLDSSNGMIFRQSGNELQMIPFTVAGNTLSEGTPRTLLHGVGTNDFRITFEPQRSAVSVKTGSPAYDQLKRASIVLTVRPTSDTSVKGEEQQGQTVTLSASIMPRKNIW